MSASRVETVERPRREAPADVRHSHLLLKTSRLFKKVSNIRSTRRQSTDGKQQLAVPEVLRRTTRSMDLGPKDVAVLTSQHTALHMDRNSDTPSPSGESSENGPESHVDGSTMQQARSPRPASIADAVRPRVVSNGMPASPQVPEGNGVTSESRATSLTQTVSQPEDVLHPSASASRSNASTMGAPVTSPNTTPHSSPVVGTDGSSRPHVPLTSGQISPGLSDRRDLAPRLATLPPPMMASYMAKGSARLTPSIVSRQPPMPVFNLPPLPPVTPSQQFERPRQAPLRSIPALPMRGPSEAEHEDADHDNAMLDEEDEEDMDAEEDADASPGAGADAEGAASDEEMEDGTETESAATPRSRGDRIGALPEIEASRLQAEVTESLRGTVYFTPKPDGPSTPRLRPGSSSSAASDYFSSKRPDRLSDGPDSPVRTPRPADFFGSPVIRTPALGHAAYIAGMPPGSPGRPGLYQLGSRSMVDLLSMSKKGKETATSPSITANAAAERRKSKPLPNSPPTQEGEEGEESTPKPSMEPQDILPSTPTLRRQRSMPIYRTSSDPPPYPDFHPRRPGPVIQPRDEEGEECLPLYSNAIYLAAVMPRKVEFTAPGVQAKDRKWRRVLCVLEGTAFRVYKCPPSVAGVSAIESWWEKKVGVGDITVVNTGAVTQSGIRVSAVRGRSDSERAAKDDSEPASPDPNTRSDEPPSPVVQQTPTSTRSKLRLPGSLLHPSRLNNAKSNAMPSRLSVSSSQSTNSALNQPRRSTEPAQDDHSSISVVPRTSTDTPSSRRTSYMSNATSPRSVTPSRPTAISPPASDSASSFFRSRLLHSSPPVEAAPKQPPEPNPKDHVKTFTLQHAESGLASDYGKRKNVIRVRMEGEQFLLQAPDVAAVIDWIEGIQAATNIALDLDERPMPKGPMFPRRRRRRPRPQTGDASGGAAANGTANA